MQLEIFWCGRVFFGRMPADKFTTSLGSLPWGGREGVLQSVRIGVSQGLFNPDPI